MGVLPLQFLEGENPESLGLNGYETLSICGLSDGIEPGDKAMVKAVSDSGKITEFEVLIRLDSSAEKEYYRNGGILHTVLLDMMGAVTD